MPLITKDPRTAEYHKALREYDKEKTPENKAKLAEAEKAYNELNKEMATVKCDKCSKETDSPHHTNEGKLCDDCEVARLKKIDNEIPELDKVVAELKQSYKILKNLRAENQEMRKALAENVKQKVSYREKVKLLKERKKELLGKADEKGNNT